MASRRARRRYDRKRVKRGRTAHPISIPVRILVAVIGLGLVVGGGFLLTHPAGPHTTSRLPRVAGMMVLIGVILIIAAAIGRM